jgi:hypothetical protein
MVSFGAGMCAKMFYSCSHDKGRIARARNAVTLASAARSAAGSGRVLATLPGCRADTIRAGWAEAGAAERRLTAIRSN